MTIWTAAWIAPLELEDGPARQRPVYQVAGGVHVNGDIAYAELRITAHGIYEAFVNGVRVGDLELTPGWTAYRNRLQVQTFDVTDLLAVGGNVIGAFLPGAPPKTTDSAMKIAKYFHDHHRSIEIGTLLLGLGLIGLFWWFGSLWRTMVDAEGGSARMASVALIGLGVAAPLALMSGVISSTVALQVGALSVMM